MKPNNYKKQGGLKGANTFRLTLAAALVSSFTASLNAQEAQIEEVVVSGIRSSLATALEEKRSASNLIEVIQAEDIGKLPDQNLA